MLDPPLAWQLLCSLPLLLLAAVHFSCSKSRSVRRTRVPETSELVTLQSKQPPSSEERAPNLDVYNEKVRSCDRPKASEDVDSSALGTGRDGGGSEVELLRPFPSLPNELHVKILAYLPVVDRMRARAVNRYWYKMEEKEKYEHDELVLTDNEEFAADSKSRNMATMFLTGKTLATFFRGLTKLNRNYLFKQIIFKVSDPDWAEQLKFVARMHSARMAVDIEDDMARNAVLQPDLMKDLTYDREHVSFGGHIPALSDRLIKQFTRRVVNGKWMLRSIHFGQVPPLHVDAVQFLVDVDGLAPDATATVTVSGKRKTFEMFAGERVIVVADQFTYATREQPSMVAIHRLNEDGTWPTDIPVDVLGKHRVTFRRPE